MLRNSKYIVIPGIFLILFIILFVVFKINHLQLPYFWDEAWSYIPAVFKMYEKRPTLIPGNVDPMLFRGHPLFFYFIESSWMKVAGTSIVSLKSLSLILSVLLMLATFYLGIIIKDAWFGLICTICMSVQAIFVAQSSFVLPEVLVSLLTVGIFIAYFKKIVWMEIICSSLVLLTKESGIVIVVSVILFSFMEIAFPWFYEKNNDQNISIFTTSQRDNKIGESVQRKILKLILRFIPLLFFFIFIILQKKQMGWFFFPEHINMMTTDFSHFLKKLQRITTYIFIQQGRLYLTLLGAISFLYVLFRKRREMPIFYLLHILFFIIGYIIFSALNFFANRYILSVLPFLVLIFVYPIFQLKGISKWIPIALFLVIIIAIVRYTFTNKSPSDHTLGFVDAVKVDQEVVQYCEQQHWENKIIMGYFLMHYYLNYPEIGYRGDTLSGSFQITPNLNSNPEIAIIPSLRLLDELIAIRNSPDWKLIKRFEKNQTWVEIYERRQ